MIKEGAKSFFRGHPIVFQKERWIFADNGSELPATGGEVRGCKKCRKNSLLHESDPCLGNLPGVDNACCGHGQQEESYVRFTNGVTLVGFKLKEKVVEEQNEAFNPEKIEGWRSVFDFATKQKQMALEGCYQALGEYLEDDDLREEVQYQHDLVKHWCKVVDTMILTTDAIKYEWKGSNVLQHFADDKVVKFQEPIDPQD